jgi:hypothetical protein
VEIDATTVAGFKPPYMAFRTFWSFIEDLASKPLPPAIDRSMMSSKSGTDQMNLMQSMRTFGLMNEDGTVLPALVDLTDADPDIRKKNLEQVVRTFYTGPLKVSEQHGTEQQLKDSFKDTWDLSSTDTLRKAITFFLHAARAADIELSSYFPNTRSGSGSPGKGKPRRSGSNKKKSTLPDGHVPPSSEKYRLDVELETGGSMTLTVSVDPIRLRGEDRDFFYDVVDKLSDYRDSHQRVKSSKAANEPNVTDEGDREED